MAMTAAERQRKYRQKTRGEGRVTQLSLWVEIESYLARWSGKSRGQCLKDLLRGIQKKSLEDLSKSGSLEAWEGCWRDIRIDPKEAAEDPAV